MYNKVLFLLITFNMIKRDCFTSFYTSLSLRIMISRRFSRWSRFFNEWRKNRWVIIGLSVNAIKWSKRNSWDPSRMTKRTGELEGFEIVLLRQAQHRLALLLAMTAWLRISYYPLPITYYSSIKMLGLWNFFVVCNKKSLKTLQLSRSLCHPGRI